MNSSFTATAVAHSNIALIKYWGKLDREGNYPAVSSLSLTLDAFCTRTRVTFDDALKEDVFELDGTPTFGRPLERVTLLLNTIRSKARIHSFARAVSTNNYPTAAGLASSASGFAALALAAASAARIDATRAELSSLARACSASAARSIFGGFATLKAGAESAAPLADAAEWPVALVVAVTESGPKAIGSTEAMNRCSKTSPCYPAWVESSNALFLQACESVHNRDLDSLGACMEESTWFMHATMLTAAPAVLYLAPSTLEVIHEVRRRRSPAVPAYFTTDAGPHVKVLTLAKYAEVVKGWLLPLNGVRRVEICKPGPAAYRITSPSGEP